MNSSVDLHGKNILVTGASGFIGSRLVEYLVEYCHANVRALVRNFGRAVHIARLPVTLVPGELADLESLRRAVQGCEIVFHCAAGMAGEDEERRAATIDGTHHMLLAAREANVSRFVHVSSVAVYGPDPGPTIDEHTPLVKSGNVYADAKLEADQMVSRFGAEKGLPVTILRPAIVYGPRSGSWTLGPINGLRSGRLTLIDGGQGLANHVYIDDVIQALLLAAIRPEAIGEAFIISSGNVATWKEFLGHYARMLGSDRMLGSEIRDITSESIKRQTMQIKRLRNPFYMGLTFFASPHARSVIQQVSLLNSGSKMVTRMVPKRLQETILTQAETLRALKLNPPLFPDPWMVRLYTAKGICKIESARRALGYQPRVSLSEGMQYTEAWLRHTRLIPGGE